MTGERPLRIVHAPGWYFPDSIGGTEVYVAELASRQLRRGHSVTVVSPLANMKESSARYEHEGVDVVRYAVPANPTKPEASGRSRARGSEAFYTVVQELKPDIVHFHTFTTGLGLPEMRAARATGARLIATNHLGSLGYICQRGTLMKWGREPCDGITREFRCAACARVSPLVIRNNRKRQAAILAQLDRFVLLSRSAVDIVAANHGDRDKLECNHLGTGIADQVRKPSPAVKPTKGPIRFGYVGRLVEIKGVLDLARAFHSLPLDLDVRLEICGPADSASREMMAEVRSLIGNDRRVEFPGAVHRTRISAKLSSLDVLCVPSVTFEGGPTIVNESIAAGTPVIGTSLGAMPELIRDGIDGALVSPGNWTALAALMLALSRDPSIVDRWRANLPRARTMDDVAADYEATYRAMLESGH
jgi:glycosyltransferase involved in cell wall biosynthesis